MNLLQRLNTEQKLLTIMLFVIVGAKLGIHFYSNGAYGFHRDELLHMSVGEHLDWGFMEFPPLIGVIAELQRFLFGESVMAVRVFPALIGGFLILLSVWMTRQLGGKLTASFVAAICTFSAISYFRNHTLFQPVVFDQLFWSLGFGVLLLFLKEKKIKYLLILGLVVGLGLQMKYTMLFWAAGAVIALATYEKGRLLRLKWTWISVGIALLIFLPNIMWQSAHNFPVLAHFTGLYEVQLEEISRLDFLRGQLLSMNVFSIPIWLGGLLFLFFSKEMKPYKPLGLVFLISGLLLCIAKGKAYYFYGAYPIVFAAGALAVERVVTKKWLVALWAIPTVALTLAYVPNMVPVLPINEFVNYADIEPTSEGRYDGLTGDYADMFGWEEQVALVDSLYQGLSVEDRKKCILWAENYGEAGAIKIIGDRYKLPNPVCKHGSFWLWGAGEASGEIAISIGNEEGAVSYFYEEYELVKLIKHPYAIGEEHNIPLYICKKPKVLLKDYWPNYESRIFE